MAVMQRDDFLGNGQAQAKTTCRMGLVQAVEALEYVGDDIGRYADSVVADGDKRPPILIGGYVDAVLKRAALGGDGWLTYFYTPEGFTEDWAKVRAFAEEGGKDPDTLISTNQLPIIVGERDKVEHGLHL